VRRGHLCCGGRGWYLVVGWGWWYDCGGCVGGRCLWLRGGLVAASPDTFKMS
jgi:hypothetical protein